jgi:hypothetical protein
MSDPQFISTTINAPKVISVVAHINASTNKCDGEGPEGNYSDMPQVTKKEDYYEDDLDDMISDFQSIIERAVGEYLDNRYDLTEEMTEELNTSISKNITDYALKLIPIAVKTTWDAHAPK